MWLLDICVYYELLKCMVHIGYNTKSKVGSSAYAWKDSTRSNVNIQGLCWGIKTDGRNDQDHVSLLLAKLVPFGKPGVSGRLRRANSW